MTQHTERQKHGSSSGGPERPTTSRVVDTVGSPHAAMAGVPVTAVRLDDVLLEPRRKLNASVSIPHQIEACERTGRLDNFRKAAGQEAGTHQGRAYDDSDVFKVLEAACWQVATEPDEDIGAWIDQTVADIAAAQEEDGYLYTCQQLCRPKRERWQDLTHGHELYCGGHLIQAALAHRRVTGCDTLFDVAGSYYEAANDRGWQDRDAAVILKLLEEEADIPRD